MFSRTRWSHRLSRDQKSRHSLPLFRPLIEPLEERWLLSTFVVADLNDAGAGSLRQALLDANHTSGSAVIDFQVAGTIRLTSGPLPPVTTRVNIDGTSAPGFEPIQGTPVVAIDYHGFAGLEFDTGSAGSALRSLSLTSASGAGVSLHDPKITVVGNFIGVQMDGETRRGNSGPGVQIDAASSGDTIGGSTPRERNLISGNHGDGLVVNGASHDTIAGNFIGTDVTGTAALANDGNGILLTAGASANTLGGTDTGGNDPTKGVFVRPPDGNLISGNHGDGVVLTDGANNNVLEGNFIGTQISGISALGNDGDGVAIDAGSDNNSLLGTVKYRRPFIYYNVVSGNHGNGLVICDSNNTIIHADFFGLGSDNQTPVGNGQDGVLVEGSSANTTFGGRIPLGNVVAANKENGVVVQDTASGFTSFNTFCGAGAFVDDLDLGNSKDGFLITSTGGNNLLLVNQVDNNGKDGIEISGEASGVQVTRTIVGIPIDNMKVLPNKGNGIELSGDAHDNLIGGTVSLITLGSHNVMSGNLGYGVAFTGTAHDNLLNFSFIGTDLRGNRKGGVLLGPGTYANTVGSTDSSLPTIIAGNDGDGIDMKGTRDNTVVGTLIGKLDRKTALPNQGNGIFIFQSSHNLIGGSTGGAANVIAFNNASGVFIKSGRDNGIRGNSIYDNADLGIYLQGNANNRQTSPVLTSALLGPGRGVLVSGTLTSTRNTTFLIQLFANRGSPSPGANEGLIFLGSVLVKTDSSGFGSFTYHGKLRPDVTSLTATATDPQDNTSAFSLPLLLGT
jgi:parallel beta-helix repeat protein